MEFLFFASWFSFFSIPSFVDTSVVIYADGTIFNIQRRKKCEHEIIILKAKTKLSIFSMNLN